MMQSGGKGPYIKWPEIVSLIVRKQPHAVFHYAHLRTTMSHVQGTTFGRSEGSELDRLGKDVSL